MTKLQQRSGWTLKRVMVLGLIASLYGVLLIWLWSLPEVRLYSPFWLRWGSKPSIVSIQEAGCQQEGGVLSEEAVRAALQRNKELLLGKEAER
ncbi:MAG: hypothetical protein K6U12_08365 [Armatimonadetes bacterium]|nr:hypothetical protein [Armatimonadota bacterium]